MISFLMDEFDTALLDPLKIHKEIAKLPLTPIITTNWDTLTEKELGKANKNSHTIIDDKDTRKKQKQIKREISQLKKQIKKLEFRPCHNDSELKQK